MILRLHVKPNSKTDSITVDDGGNIRVRIRALPIDGKANKYLLEYLAEVFRLPKSKIEIIKGFNSPHKVIELHCADDHVKKILKTFRC